MPTARGSTARTGQTRHVVREEVRGHRHLYIGRTSPTAALLATGKELRERWTKLTPAVRSAIIDEIAVVTVLPGRRGVRGFNPEYIDIRWKVEP